MTVWRAGVCARINLMCVCVSVLRRRRSRLSCVRVCVIYCRSNVCDTLWRLRPPGGLDRVTAECHVAC